MRTERIWGGELRWLGVWRGIARWRREEVAGREGEIGAETGQERCIFVSMLVAVGSSCRGRVIMQESEQVIIPADVLNPGIFSPTAVEVSDNSAAEEAVADLKDKNDEEVEVGVSGGEM